jgi:hypothetical protein
MDLRRAHGADLQPKFAVVEEHLLARFYVGAQLGIIAGDPLNITGNVRLGGDDEGCTFLQLNRSLTYHADADLGSGEVG